jgi:hypothetical protein
MPTYASADAWAKAKNTHKIFLLTLTGKRKNGGAVETITRYYATEWYATLPGDSPANQEYKPLLKKVPNLTQTIAFVNGLGQNGSPQSFAAFGTAVLANQGDALSTDWGTGGYSPEGWDIVLEVVGPHEELAYADRIKILTGVAGRHSVNDWEMTVELHDNAEKWNVTIGDTKLTTTEFANLPVEAGYKPVVTGTVYNMEPPLIDNLNFKYLLSGEEAEAVPTVYSDRKVLVLTTDYTLQLTASEGAQLTLVSNPGDAKVTCDVKGRKIAHLSDTHSNNKADIVESYLREDGGAVAGDFDSAAMTAFKTATHDVGLLTTQPTKLLDEIDRLLATPCEYFVVAGDGTVSFHEFKSRCRSPRRLARQPSQTSKPSKTRTRSSGHSMPRSKTGQSVPACLVRWRRGC